jgi:hypothetical protein
MFSPKAEIERSVNCFRQRVETGQGVGPTVLLRSPGYSPIRQPSGAAGVHRGGFELNNNIMDLIGGSAFLLDSNFAEFRTYPGISNLSNSYVRMCSSPTAIMFVSDGILYRAGTTLTQPAGATLPLVIWVDVACIDTYFVAIDNSTNLYFSSDDGVTWNAADVQAAEAAPNNNVACIVQSEILYIYSNRLSLPFVVVSNANAPFQIQKSGIGNFGLNAFASLQTLGNYRYWLGRNKDGQGVVYRAQQYAATRVSNLALENKIREYQRDFGTDDAIGMTFQQNGQEFYRLTFPAADASWELNCTLTEQTGIPEWEEVLAWNFQESEYHRHRANMIVSAFGKVLMGDYENGWLYELSPDYYTDAGYPQRGNRRSPHVLQNNDNIIYSELQVGAETGVGLLSPLWIQSYTMDAATFAAALAVQVGLTTVTAAQALVLQNIYDLVPYIPLDPYPTPDVMNGLGFVPWGAPSVLADGTTTLGGPPMLSMSYSSDGGKSFNASLDRSLGNAGQYVRVLWDRLGLARDKVFDFVWDHPCKFALTSAWFDPEDLGS